MKRFIAGIIALLMIVMSAAAFADVPDPGTEGYFLDTADVLSEATEGEIYFNSKALHDECGADIVIVAVDSIGNEDIYDYTYEMFNKWGIGDKDKNNGFLLVMTVQEDNYYALAGMGLEGVLSSSVIKDMLDTYLEPDFAEKDYDAGARKFYEAVFRKIAEYYNSSLTVEDGIKQYEAWKAEDSSTMAATTSGKTAFGGGSATDYEEDRNYIGNDYAYEKEDHIGIFAVIVFVLIILFFISILSVGRGGSFWFWRPGFFWPVFGPRRYPPNWHDRRGPRGPGGFGGPGGPGGFGGPGHGGPGGHSGGGFGGGHSGGSFGSGRSTGGGSFGSGRSFGGGSFGGGRSFGGGSFGGGRSMGGGAGRGRH